MRVERLREEFDVALDVYAFELRPGIPPEGISREHASRGRVYPPGYLENLQQTALASGINMKRPTLIPNTRLAHEATEFGREQGRLWEIHRAIFHAYFEEEQNIGDVEALCRVGAGIGLDAAALREALESGRYTSTVLEQMEWSRAAGITGVPTAIFDERFALVGAQDYAVYRDVAARMLRRGTPVEE